MFKLFRVGLLLILIVLVVIGTYLWVARVPTLEQFLSKKLNTKVVIDDVEIGLNRVLIKGLKLENPPSSALPFAFKGGDLSLKLHLFSLLKNQIVIDEVKITHAMIGIELYNTIGNDNNWASLLNGLPSGGDKTCVIKQLIIENLKFTVVRSSGKEFSIPEIPYLEFANIGGDKALTVPQVFQLIFQTLLSSLTHSSNLKALLEHVPALDQNTLKGVSSTLPLEQTQDLLEENVDKLKKKMKEASEFFQDLFSNALQIIPSDHKILCS